MINEVMLCTDSTTFLFALKKAGKLRRNSKEDDTESEYEDVQDQESNDEDIDSGYRAPMQPSLTEHDFHDDEETVGVAVSNKTQTNTSALTERLKIALRSKLFPEDGNAWILTRNDWGKTLLRWLNLAKHKLVQAMQRTRSSMKR